MKSEIPGGFSERFGNCVRCPLLHRTGKSNPVMEFAQRSFPPEPKVRREEKRARGELWHDIYIFAASKSNHRKERPREFASAAKVSQFA
jgi:hypothetical protein